MSFSDPISSQSIIRAISEYDKLGRNRFLNRYGYGKARKYFLVYQGKHYDSKAIVGVAHGYEYPHIGPLSSNDFVGGRTTVMPKLERLGFVVRIIE